MFRFLCTTASTAAAFLVLMLIPRSFAAPAGPVHLSTTPDCRTISLVGVCVQSATTNGTAGNSTQAGYCLSSNACPATLGRMQGTFALRRVTLGGSLAPVWPVGLLLMLCLGSPEKPCANVGFVCMNAVSCHLTGTATFFFFFFFYRKELMTYQGCLLHIDGRRTAVVVARGCSYDRF